MLAVHDLDQWLEQSSKQCRVSVTAAKLRSLFSTDVTGERQPAYTVRYRLPLSVTRQDPTLWEMEGMDNLLKSKEKFSQEEVATVMEALLTELNGKYHVNLGTGGEQAAIQDDNLLVTEEKELRVILVGGSHTRRIGAVMAGMEVVSVVDLSRPGLVLTDEVAAELTRRLTDKLQEEFGGETLVVYNIFDNLCYLQGGDEGWKAMERLEDGHYHAKGKIRVAEVGEVRHLFRAATALFRAGGQNKKVIIPPMERYVNAKCCSDMRHMTNYSSEFLSRAAAKLTDIRKALADHLHMRRLLNYKVISSYSLLGQREDSNTTPMGALWDDDPVHMNSAGYAIMAESLMDMLVEEPSSFCNKPREREQVVVPNRSFWISNEEVGEAGPARKRGRSPGWPRGGGGGRGWRGSRRGW